MRRFAAVMSIFLTVISPLRAQTLPDLGGVGDTVLSPQMERRIGENVMRDFRRDPQYLGDPEISDYLGSIGSRLAQATPGVRQDLRVFVLRDPTINAFALPGGFIGVNTGLIEAADTESELAAVLGHEIGHIAHRDMVRSVEQQQQMQVPMLAAMLAAVLLARSRPDLAVGAAVGAQAGAVQSQLAYSREFERDADRTGMDALERAGFDPHAMPAFFEKLQRMTRLSDDGSIPSYLRTHPLTSDRIATAEARADALPYRQHVDSLEFFLVKAKLRAEEGPPQDAVEHYRGVVRDGRYTRQAAARYGLVSALLRARRFKDAEAQMPALRAAGSSPMIETLAARVKQGLGDADGAIALLAAARHRYPYSGPVLYAYAEALEDAGRNAQAVEVLADPLRLRPSDARLHELAARGYAALGKRLLQHKAQAEAYALQGNLSGAIEQLQIARNAGDGDFYQLSVIDARLRDLRAERAEEQRDLKQQQ